MKWLMLSTSLFGCSFTSPPGGQPDPADHPDAPKSIDASIDSQTAAPPACQVGVASSTGTDRGRAGKDGGSTRTPLACASAQERIVGLQLQLSDGDTVYGGKSAYALSIACAPVTIDHTGVASVGTVSTREFLGVGDPQFGWKPATKSTLTLCRPGWLMSGINIKTGSGDDEHGRFLDVSIHCAQIGYDGARTGSPESIKVTGSGTETTGSDTADCNSDEVLAQLPLRAGQGIDSVNMACSTPRCQ
jgi:hypothetical protein